MCGFFQPHHALVNGVLHWIITCIPGFSRVLLSFDFEDEKLRVLSLSKSFSQENINHPMGLVELDGFLSLYHRKADGSFGIWIMKDYGDKQSRTKEFSVAQPILSGLRGCFLPLCILKKDEVCIV
ncbi:hypothetical protein NE237_032502 [Protea cynaroides]|uniref:F-box associated beta-propeller type 3 domain-containing protein n=1 Tax=Protea cynaroides TaxID=273540 RepID=A0A9Q0L3M9_9MAGN|nr:hypothetical protein NE237_032502 [Protea cynaroides]